MRSVYLIKVFVLNTPPFWDRREDGTYVAFMNRREAVKYARRRWGYAVTNKGQIEWCCQIVKA